MLLLLIIEILYKCDIFLKTYLFVLIICFLVRCLKINLQTFVVVCGRLFVGLCLSLFVLYCLIFSAV